MVVFALVAGLQWSKVQPIFSLYGVDKDQPVELLQ
jgi:hypothetical protein